MGLINHNKGWLLGSELANLNILIVIQLCLTQRLHFRFWRLIIFLIELAMICTGRNNASLYPFKTIFSGLSPCGYAIKPDIL